MYSFFCGRQRNNDLVVRVLARGVGDLTSVLALLVECRLQHVTVPDALINKRITVDSRLTGARWGKSCHRPSDTRFMKIFGRWIVPTVNTQCENCFALFKRMLIRMGVGARN